MESKKLSHTPFVKYQGAGNDFILIDDPDARFPVRDEQGIARLCHRRWGIGADGLILLKYTTSGHLWMQYFNADGQLATMCGNGGRCFAHFAYEKGYTYGSHLKFWAADGWHTATISSENQVELTMQPVQGIQLEGDAFILDTGSPHYLIFESAEDLDEKAIASEGAAIRYQSRFGPRGINVNYISVLAPRTLKVRTYERGVEAETYACGTGVVAASLAHAYSERMGQGPVQVTTHGGILSVDFRVEEWDNFSVVNISLKGPAKWVFEGYIPI